MPGSPGALRLIEWTAMNLCRALSGSADRLQQAVSAGTVRDAAVGEAAGALLSQLQLRQAAWGRPADDPVPLHRVTALLHGLPAQVAVDLSGLPPTTVFAPPVGQIVLNVLLLAADSLPGGGRIVVAGGPDDLFVRIIGPAARWPNGLALCLAAESEADAALTDGRNLQMALTALLAHRAGIRLSAIIPASAHAEPAILRLGR